MKKTTVLLITLLTANLISTGYGTPMRQARRSSAYLGIGKYDPNNYKLYQCSISSCTDPKCRRANVNMYLEKKKLEKSRYSFRVKNHKNVIYLFKKLNENKNFMRWCKTTHCNLNDASIVNVDWTNMYKYINLRIPVKVQSNKTIQMAKKKSTVSLEIECVPYNKDRAFKIGKENKK